MCSQYSMGTLLKACWMGRMLRSVLIVFIQDMLPMVSKGLGKACFNAIMSQTWAVEQGEVTCTLSADLVGPVDLEQRQCARAGFIIDLTGVLVELLCFIPLICEELPELILREVVFLMLQQLVWDGVLQCDEDASTSRSWKVTAFTVFLVLLGLRGIGTSMLSIWDVAAKLALNALIPSLSKVT